MNLSDTLYGTGVALITPFTKDEQIDYPSLEKLIAYVSNHGVDYLVVLGTTGENATINRKDRQAILRFVCEHNPRSLPVVFGHGGNNTRELIDELKTYDLSGVTAILSVSPYYNKPSQEGIYRHYAALADVSPVPLLLYNVPGRTGSNILSSTTIRLSAHENIIGIKEASGSLEQALQIKEGTPDDFLLISGDDMLTLPIYSIGGTGVISVLANALPHVFQRIKDSFSSGNISEASKAASSLTEINPLMYEEANPVGLKALLSHMGLCDKVVRLPLIEASASLEKRIISAYETFQVTN